MAKLTRNDRDVRDAKIVKGRILNLDKLVSSLLNMGLVSYEDLDDLQEVQNLLQKIIKRYADRYI